LNPSTLRIAQRDKFVTQLMQYAALALDLFAFVGGLIMLMTQK
jgi:hypothetical protein